MDAPGKWFWFALLSAVFAALTNIFAKIGVAQISSNMATWIRVIVIFCVTSAIIFARHEWTNPAEMPRTSLIFIVLSGVATGLSWLCGFYALQIGQASQVSPVDKLSVLMVMILGVIFLGETLSIRQWFGGILILAGVILVALPDKKPDPAANVIQDRA